MPPVINFVEFIKTHNYIRNCKTTRKRLNLTSKQLWLLIEKAVEQNVLVKYNDTLYQVNREKLPLQPKEKVQTSDTLKQYLEGKTELRNISKVANELGLPYQRVRKEVDKLCEQGVLSIQNETSHCHRVYCISSR